MVEIDICFRDTYFVSSSNEITVDWQIPKGKTTEFQPAFAAAIFSTANGNFAIITMHRRLTNHRDTTTQDHLIIHH